MRYIPTNDGMMMGMMMVCCWVQWWVQWWDGDAVMVWGVIEEW